MRRFHPAYPSSGSRGLEPLQVNGDKAGPTADRTHPSPGTSQPQATQTGQRRDPIHLTRTQIWDGRGGKPESLGETHAGMGDMCTPRRQRFLPGINSLLFFLIIIMKRCWMKWCYSRTCCPYKTWTQLSSGAANQKQNLTTTSLSPISNNTVSVVFDISWKNFFTYYNQKSIHLYKCLGNEAIRKEKNHPGQSSPF